LYLRAIEEQDCVADAYCNLGILESKKENTNRAFDCFTTSLKHNPRHSEAHYNLGNLYFEVNDFRLAQTHYGNGAPRWTLRLPMFISNLGLVQAINNDFHAAVSALSKYRELVRNLRGELPRSFCKILKKHWRSPKILDSAPRNLINLPVAPVNDQFVLCVRC